MEIHYQITFDDFLEASEHHHQHMRSEQRSRSRRLRSVLKVIFAIDLAMIALIVLLVAKLSPARAYSIFGFRFYAAGRTALNTLTVAPWIGLIVFCFVLGLAMRRLRYASYIVGAVGIAVAGVAVLQFVLAYDYLATVTRSARPGPTAPWTPITFNNVFGWVVLLLLWLLMTISLAKSPRKFWKQQSNLHGAKTVQFRSDGFRLSDENQQSDYLWEAIYRIVDAPSVLLLYVNELHFHIIPKRAFENETARQDFWRMVPERLQANTGGFPVMPVQQPA